ncbi:hypothetical protein PIB30_091945 [Stylosanthes scabra]|uniref:Uncharacterized protein n=1 Tax=Stylosanthes scabra TaxID=79078 RepID=A0ABU6WVT8_9FABA|nr:hypothetical protein [Stylosanthes scabra]
MYDHLVRINVSIVREFYSNFLSSDQDDVFLRGNKYLFLSKGIVNLPRIMREVMVKEPTTSTDHCLPYQVMITKLATATEVPVFPENEFLEVKKRDMYC